MVLQSTPLLMSIQLEDYWINEPQTFSRWSEKGKGITGWRDKSSSRALWVELAVAY